MNPQRLRLAAAQPRSSTISGRRRSIGSSAVAVDRADRRLGRGRGAAGRDPLRIRKQREHRRLLAAKGAASPAAQAISFAYRQFWCWEPPARPPLATVVNSRGGQGSASAAALSSISSATCSPIRRKRRRLSRRFAASPGQIVIVRTFPTGAATRSASSSTSIPAAKHCPKCACCCKADGPARQRNLALSMDSLTIAADARPAARRARRRADESAAGHAGADPVASSIAAQRPQPLASRRGDARALRWRASSSSAARLALTVYGAREMYGVVDVGGDHHPRNGRCSCCSSSTSPGSRSLSPARRRLRLASVARQPLGRCRSGCASKTAVVMPIYNEAPSRVFAALQAIYEDVAGDRARRRTSTGSSSPTPPIPTSGSPRSARLLAMRGRLGPDARVYYRRRREERQPQGRQHRRFRHALGRRLSRTWSCSTPTA